MNSPARVLLVEDEPTLAAGIRENLEAEGYGVEHIERGDLALDAILKRDFDLVVLDVMLPGLDGYTVCSRARQAKRRVPILFLTARGESADRIRGLEAGGDDYLAKPFHLEEFLLRIRAILRRRLWLQEASQETKRISFGGNEFDIRAMRATSFDGRTHDLTQKEAMILQTLASREGQVVSRDEILDAVWGYEVFPSSRTVDNFIVRLRKRFEPRPDEPRYIHTVRGIGYRFTSGDPP
ncbi:MAG: DNA-binding response regulator [Rickettsiales bacterium]|nr:DNA-binding response regulator [Rickettsiales bacterium]|tara:strand:+ start:316 stop:1029 length:714 start_codon:yes stop_codon:yes gene_type:complete